MAVYCSGNQEWPELLGAKAEVAQKVIERQNPGVKVLLIKQGMYRIHDFRCDRVWVWTSEYNSGIVVEVPRVG